MPMRLVEGLRAGRKSRVAFAGAGGKTTALFTLARQLPGPVICLNTTHLAVDQAQHADIHHILTGPGQAARLMENTSSGVLLFSGPEDGRGRLLGVPLEITNEIKATADMLEIPLLIEADGSRRHPLKGPADHEPPIPDWVTQVVYMFGLSVVGRPLTGEHVFRPEIFAQLSGARLERQVELEHIVRYLVHPQGGMKNVPPNAQKTMFANQSDQFPFPQPGWNDLLAKLVPTFDTVLVGSLHDPVSQIHWRYEQVAGIVLAAGGSERMGKIKQLLTWQGKPLVRHAVETAIHAGLKPVIVVTGAAASEVSSAVADLPVEIVHNESWRSGQAGSIRAGVEALPRHSGGAVFLLSDMPRVPVDLIKREVDLHRQEPAFIICPQVGERRGNPVLFDRQTFGALRGLTGDSGGRKLMEHYPVRWIEWNDTGILQDIDTPQDFQNLEKGDFDAG